MIVLRWEKSEPIPSWWVRTLPQRLPITQSCGTVSSNKDCPLISQNLPPPSFALYPCCHLDLKNTVKT